MKELMVLVERAVRPVRASDWRKMKMRQELLAHLTAAYEEELARLGDARAALEEAARRFGNPAELSRTLQTSVPLIERVLLAPVPGTKWTAALEGRVARKSRLVLWVAFWSLVGVALAGPAVGLYVAWPDAPGRIRAIEYLALCGGMTALLLVIFAATCSTLVGGRGAAAWLRAAGYLLLAVVPPLVALAWGLRSMLDTPVEYGSMVAYAVVLYLGFVGLAVVVRFEAEAKRLTEEWTSLEIGD